jgi:hypothetical protein
MSATPQQIEELARDLAAAKLAGLIPMTRAEAELWSRAYQDGAAAELQRFRAMMEAAKR